jgi:hypothetical protein
MPRHWPQLLVVIAIALSAGNRCRAEAEAAKSLGDDRTALYADYRQKLSALAGWCDERKLTAEAGEVRAWLPVRKRDKTYLYVLDPLRRTRASATLTTAVQNTSTLAAGSTNTAAKNTARQKAAAPASENQREFRTRWQALRAEQAPKLYELAKRAAAEHEPSLAVELVTEAARESQDFKPAWRFLGYVKYAGAWRTPFEIKQLGEGNVWHDRFGWIPQSYVDRYEQGQRFYRNRWMPAAEEAKKRSNIRDGWQVETAHYLVTTNHSLEEGVALAGQLEQLYAIWQQVFAGYVTSDADLVRRLAKGEPARDRDPEKHKVVYYRSRKEYNQALVEAQPQIAMTLGIYFDGPRTAYFFADEDQEPTTIFHEATHQLFQESRPVTKDVGHKDNFWIIEAVACYMESLEALADYFTHGGPDDGRMPAARHRLLQDNFYCPLAELVSLGKQGLQHHTDIAKLYSESAGLAAFLLDRHPAATVKYLQSVYAGNADHNTLARLTGRSYGELDAEYRAFMGGKANSEFGIRNSESDAQSP